MRNRVLSLSQTLSRLQKQLRKLKSTEEPSKSLSSRQDRPAFRIFDLPGELRNRIYEYVFQNESYFVVDPNHPPRHLQRRCLPPTLTAGGFFLPHPARWTALAVNRRMRIEIAPLVFAKCIKLWIESNSALKSLTECIGSIGLARVEVIIFEWNHHFVENLRTTPLVSTTLGKFKNLKRIKIYVSYPARYEKYHSANNLDPMPPAEFVRLHGLKEMHLAGVEIELDVLREELGYRDEEWRSEVLGLMQET